MHPLCRDARASAPICCTGSSCALLCEPMQQRRTDLHQNGPDRLGSMQAAISSVNTAADPNLHVGWWNTAAGRDLEGLRRQPRHIFVTVVNRTRWALAHDPARGCRELHLDGAAWQPTPAAVAPGASMTCQCIAPSNVDYHLKLMALILSDCCQIRGGVLRRDGCGHRAAQRPQG